MGIRKIIYGICVCMLWVSAAYAQKVVYVNIQAKGTNDGSSWKNAFTQLRKLHES